MAHEEMEEEDTMYPKANHLDDWEVEGDDMEPDVCKFYKASEEQI